MRRLSRYGLCSSSSPSCFGYQWASILVFEYVCYGFHLTQLWILTCFVSFVLRSLMRCWHSHICFCLKTHLKNRFDPLLHLSSLIDMWNEACMDSFGPHCLCFSLVIFPCSWCSSMACTWFIVSTLKRYMRAVSGSFRVYPTSVCSYWLRISSFWFV